MAEPVLYDVSGGVATVTFNRPDAMNACDTSVRKALLAAFEQAAADPGVRALVLTGAGRAFCVGQDLKELEPLYASGDPEFGGIVEEFNAAVTALATLPKPTVAAVNGAAAGAGASFAFACDFRIAVEGAAFAMAFSKIGLVPDTGASWTLQRLVGQAKALEMLLLSEPVKAGDVPGLVTKVVPAEAFESEVAAFAAALAAGPTRAYGWIKELVRLGATATFEQSLARENDLQTAAGRTADHAAAVASFLRKEKPVFKGE